MRHGRERQYRTRPRQSVGQELLAHTSVSSSADGSNSAWACVSSQLVHPTRQQGYQQHLPRTSTHLVSHMCAQASEEVQHGDDVAPVVCQGAPQALNLQRQLISVPAEITWHRQTRRHTQHQSYTQSKTHATTGAVPAMYSAAANLSACLQTAHAAMGPKASTLQLACAAALYRLSEAGACSGCLAPGVLPVCAIRCIP
jgi:hypothetical protein